MGEFNADVSNNFVDSFCGSYSLKSLIKKPICFKNPDHSTCIDLILTKREKSFQNSTIMETGLSDFHKLTVAVLKSYFKKLKPKELIYRDFKNFSNQEFRTEHVKELNENNVGASQFELFQTVSLGLLNKLASSKKKTLRNNQSSFTTKEVQKAIMTRSRLRNKFLKTKYQECKQVYNKKRNLFVTMVRKAKKNYFNNFNVRNITDNKQFWETLKPFFSSKVDANERITLIEGDKVVSEDGEVTETFKSYFEAIVENLDINIKFMSEELVSNESVNGIIRKFQSHPSIIKIQENHQGRFSFPAVELEDVDREIDLLDASKAIHQNDIPVRIIKVSGDIFSEFIMHNFNEGISTARFPDVLKSEDVKSVFKKKYRIDKENYIPVSILPVISKIRFIFKQ